MATQKLKAFIHKYSWAEGLVVFGSCIDADEDTLFIGEHEFDYEIPADFNPVAAQVAALEKKLAEASDEHMKTVKQIKTKIAELQCIENSATVTV